MIKELVNFTKNLDEDFKSLAIKPREGLHIMLQLIKTEENVFEIDSTPIEYEIYSKKMMEESEFILKCKFLTNNSWCIDTNKCFDLPTKAIHSCSPFLVAFKREHLEGGIKFIANAEKNKSQITERFGNYFDKALELVESEEEKQRLTVFQNFFVSKDFQIVLNKIQFDHEEKRNALTLNLSDLIQEQKNEKDKLKKEQLINRIKEVELDLLHVKQLDDSDYLLFYLNEPLEAYIKPHAKYLGDKLFNTDKYNSEPNEEGLIYGTSNYMNSFNSNMPFLMHQTSTFDITGRISNLDAKYLSEFNQVLSGKILPNPLPIFVFKEELQKKCIGLFKESGYKIGYKEIVESLLKDKKEDLSNYYLLYWANTKDGISFRDLDFVSKFEYDFKATILNLFELTEKGAKQSSPPIDITNVFELEKKVFQPMIQSKYNSVDYFGELKDVKGYEELSNSFLSLTKYRKTIYDFVYKSKRQAVTISVFYDLVFNRIRDDIKHNKPYQIKEKLNIWFSLYEKFNSKNNSNEKTMASKLKDYQDFVEGVIKEEVDFSTASDEQFIFTAGQVIDYLMSKSKSADQSYQLLEPYMQKSGSKELQKAIANDFARYKHANYSGNFEKAASFVLTYETSANLKNYLPELLAGVFSKNQLFSNTKQVSNDNN